jgi:hypothetical protein
MPEITFLLGNTDDATKEKAKQIHQKAAELLTERRKARASEEALDLTAAVRETKRITSAEETREETGEETDVKNQRTLTDFF